VSNLEKIAQSDFWQFLFHEDSQETGVWKYCGVWKHFDDCL